MTRIHAHRGVDPTLDGYLEADGHLPPSIDGLSDSFNQLVSDYRNLQRRLETLPVIEQAKGLLIGRFGIDADSAFSLLQRWSNQTNVKLRDLSAILVKAAAAQRRPPTSEDPPPGPTLDTVLDWLTATPSSPGSRSAHDGGGAGMSTVNDAMTVTACQAAVELPAELIDQLADLIVFAPHPAARAAVIAALVAELQALVEWRRTVPADNESTGISRIVAAAEAHLHEMQSATGIQ